MPTTDVIMKSQQNSHKTSLKGVLSRFQNTKESEKSCFDLTARNNISGRIEVLKQNINIDRMKNEAI